jgi:hypothetical protein
MMKRIMNETTINRVEKEEEGVGQLVVEVSDRD